MSVARWNKKLGLTPFVAPKFKIVSFVSDLRGNKITNIPVGFFQRLTSQKYITDINLSTNRLAFFHEDTLSSLSELNYLTLINNNIDRLDKIILDDLKKLQKLSVQQNFITKLESGLFKSLRNLTNLSLRENQINELHGRDFKTVLSLTAIYLDYNNISSLMDTIFNQLYKLQTLDIGFNNLAQNIPEFAYRIFRRDLQLTRLGISGNGFTHLWQSYRNGFFKKEIGLDISYNNLPADEVKNLIGNIFPLYICRYFRRIGRESILLYMSRCWSTYLGLSGLKLRQLPGDGLRSLEGYIYALYLNDNQLTEFDVEDIFYGSDNNMRELQLSGNKLKTITNRQNVRFLKLQLLNISDNAILNFCNNNWQKFAPMLEMIYVDRSNIKVLDSRCLQRLSNLRLLSLKDNPLTSVDGQSLYGPLKLSTILTTRDYFCCMVPAKVTTCQPIAIELLSSCQHLLSHLSLRLYIWIVGGVAFIGNILVFCFHWKNSCKGRPKQVFRLLLFNLTVADFLMSIYLFIIAIADQFYHNHYGQYSENWLRSTPCLLAFFLGSLSSIMSILMMLLISIDLHLRTVDPIRYQSRNYKYNSFRTTIILFWLSCLLYVGIPTITSANAAGNDRVYKYSSICMPSNVDNTYFKTWILIITFLTAGIWLTICVLYYLVFIKAYRSSISVQRTSASADRKLARKLSINIIN
ncbi:G-protein coupled receptor GRL101-like protein [Trichoplax sp. H2]|nr:G-protein coupled receptor GRL101-like protein [Trichoplax sp. H2]|eukprot:RDD37289.1 G-protein coupled receptor GRL101-like protein [Trichoplax sp. H2]